MKYINKFSFIIIMYIFYDRDLHNNKIKNLPDELFNLSNLEKL